MKRQYRVTVIVEAENEIDAAEVAYRRLADGEDPDSVEMIFSDGSFIPEVTK